MTDYNKISLNAVRGLYDTLRGDDSFSVTSDYTKWRNWFLGHGSSDGGYAARKSVFDALHGAGYEVGNSYEDFRNYTIASDAKAPMRYKKVAVDKPRQQAQAAPQKQQRTQVAQQPQQPQQPASDAMSEYRKYRYGNYSRAALRGLYNAYKKENPDAAPVDYNTFERTYIANNDAGLAYRRGVHKTMKDAGYQVGDYEYMQEMLHHTKQEGQQGIPADNSWTKLSDKASEQFKSRRMPSMEETFNLENHRPVATRNEVRMTTNKDGKQVPYRHEVPVVAKGREPGEPIVVQPHELYDEMGAQVYKTIDLIDQDNAIFRGRDNQQNAYDSAPLVSQINKGNALRSGKIGDDMFMTAQDRLDVLKKMRQDLYDKFGRYVPTYASHSIQQINQSEIRSAYGKEELYTLNAAIRALEDSQEMLNEANRGVHEDEPWYHFKRARAVGRGLANGLFDARTWDFGASDLSDIMSIRRAMDKYDKHQELTSGEQGLLDALALKMATEAYFSSGIGYGYKMGQVTAQSLPFMLEMFINPASGVGTSLQARFTRYALKRFGAKLARSEGERVMQSALRNGIGEGIKTVAKGEMTRGGRRTAAMAVAGKLATRLGGDVVGASAMSATTGQVRVMADALNRMTGQARFKEDKDGKIVYAGHDAPDEASFFTAYAKAFGANTIENHSEMVGEYFGLVSKILKRGLGLSKLEKAGIRAISKIPMGDYITAFVRNASRSDFNKALDGMLKRAHYDGMAGEYLEEVAGNIENALTVGDNTLDAKEGTGVFNPELNLETFLGVSLMCGAISTWHAAGYRTPHYNAMKALKKADKEGKRLFEGNDGQWESFKKHWAEAQTTEDKQAVLQSIGMTRLSEKERAAYLGYVKAAQQLEGVEAANEAAYREDAENDDENGTRRACRASYELGQGITKPAQRRFAQYDFRMKRDAAIAVEPEAELYSDPELYALTHPEATDEQKKTMSEYAQAKAKLEGMNDALQAEHEDVVNNAQASVDRITNKDTGKVIQVKLNGQEGPVYVRSGRLVIDSNGFVDHTNSSKTIVFVDENGNTIAGDMDAGNVYEKPIVSDPKSLVDGITAKADAKLKTAQDAANGVMSFAPGSSFQFLGTDGEAHVVHIDQDQQSGQLTARIDEEQDVAPLTDDMRNQLQHGADEWMRNTYEEWRAKVEEGKQAAEAQNDESSDAEEGTAPASSEAAPSSPTTLHQDQAVAFTDAEGNVHEGRVNGETADGGWEIEFDDAAPEGKGNVDTYTTDELKALGIAPIVEGEAAPTSADIVSAEEGSSAENQPSETQTTGEVATPTAEAETASAEQPQQRAIDRIPKDKNGKRVYESAPVEDTAAALIENAKGDVDDAIETAEFMRKKTESRVGKARKDAEKAEDPETHQDIKNHIKVLEQNVTYWADVVEFLENVKKGQEVIAEEEAQAQNKEAAPASEKEAETPEASVETTPEAKDEEETLSSQIDAASAEVNTEPTEAQKEAGNYKKGHLKVGNFDITIEQPAGSIRRGTDANGNHWESKMNNTYGYFRGTEGVDGDHIDVFLSNNMDGWDGRSVFVVDQYNPDGTFDEHKVMLGFNSAEDAMRDYLANYEKGWENGRRIDVSSVSLDDFEKWMDSSKRKTKPFSEYSSVKMKTDSNASENGKSFLQEKTEALLNTSRKLTLDEAASADSHSDTKESKREAVDPDANLRADIRAARDMAKMMFPDANAELLDKIARDLNQQPLTREQREQMERIAGKFGLRIRWMKDMPQNGTFNKVEKTIYIATNSWHQLSDTFGHEMTHALKEVDMAAYERLSDALKDFARNNEERKHLQEYVDAKYSSYDAKDRWEEYVSDQVGAMISSRHMANAILFSLDHKVLGRMRDIVTRMMAAVSDFSFNTENKVRGLLRMEERVRDERVPSALENLRGAIMDAYRMAHGKVTKTAEQSAESVENAVQRGNGNITDNHGSVTAVTDDNHRVKASDRTYDTWTDNLGRQHNGTRQQLIDYMNVNGYTQDEITDFVEKMDYLRNYIRKVADFRNEDGTFKFEAFHEWNQKQPQYKRIGEKIENVVSTAIKNGEYPVNQELSTDCIKREAFTKLMNTLVARGTNLGNMGPVEINTVKNIMRKYGIQVACDLCFVEGKRLQILNWAQTIVDDWNKALEAVGLNPDELEAFDFGGYARDENGNLIDDAQFVPTEEYGTKMASSQWKAVNEVFNILTSSDSKHYEDLARRNKKNWLAYRRPIMKAWKASKAGKGKRWSDKYLTKGQQEIKENMLTFGVADPKQIYQNSTEYADTYRRMEQEYIAEHPDGFFEPNAKQRAELDKIRNNNIDTIFAKMQRLIAEHPEMRKRMQLSDLLGSKGLMQIRQENGDAHAQLWSIILGRFGTGTPKPIQDAVPYSGEVFEITDGLMSRAYVEGGARMFSFSDFDITKVFDIMQIVWDMAARKAKLQSYSKESSYVILFGKTGTKINISTLPKAVVSEELQQRFKEIKGKGKVSEERRKLVQHEGMENAGLILDGNGRITDLSWSEEHSAKPDFCMKIFLDPERNANCGAITVGASVNHSIFAAAQDWIRMVIPFHLSGMPAAARARTDVNWYFDNTPYQNTRVKVGKNYTSINSKAAKDAKLVDYDFYENEDDPNWDMRTECRKYVQWCEEKGYIPRFDWGINSDHYRAFCEREGYVPNQQIIDIMDNDMTDGVWNGYYKFITDFNAYKPVLDENGQAMHDENGHLIEESAPHRPVTNNISLSDAERLAVFGDKTGDATSFADESVLQNRTNSIQNADRHMQQVAREVEGYLEDVRRHKDGEMSDAEFEAAEFAAEHEGGTEQFFKNNDAELLMDAMDKDRGVKRSERVEENNSDTDQESAEENGVRESKRSTDLNAEYGTRWLDEQTNEDGRHTTQVKNTINSYKKFGEWVKRDAGGRKVSVLDASSGLGLGTQWMRENGIEADDVEPYPSENREEPTYRSYDDVDKKYDYIISNAVLNVIPEDWRENVLHDMADKLKDGGKMVINVRGAESIAKQGKEGKTRVTLDEPSEILVLRPNGSIKAYQKGFTKTELKEWCEKELGDGYSVEIANNMNAGGSYDTAVVVTKSKNGVRESKRSLVGVHNITEEKLAKALKLGGLANPSVAVIDSDKQSHNGFGAISLILPSNMVAKRTGRNAGTFFGDAWTPMFPHISKVISSKGYGKIADDARKLPDAAMAEEMRRAFVADYLEDGRSGGLEYWFLHDRGMEPDVVKKQGSMSKADVEAVRKATDVFYAKPKDLTKEQIEVLRDVESHYEGKTREYWEKEREKCLDFANDEKSKDKVRDFWKKRADQIEHYGMPEREVTNLIQDAIMESQSNGDTDVEATRMQAAQYVRDHGLEGEFNDWLEEKEKQYDVKNKLFQGYTPIGNRRYKDATLENISKEMKKQGLNGASGHGFSFNNFCASVMEKTGSLSELRKRKDMLTADHADMDAFTEKWGNVYSNLADAMNPNPSDIFNDAGYSRIDEVALQSDPKSYAKKVYGVDLTEQNVKDIHALINAIRTERPTMYFETKFERPVMLNEFASAVVPSDISEKVRKGLEEAGLKLHEYDRNKDGDRERAFNEAINERDDVKFSKRTPSSSELALRDGLVERLREAGLGVSLGEEEGQRVLDMVNGAAREHKVYHGSHADFDHFDHSFMNSGEGAQAYGWGSYVTEVKGIGRTYAKQIAYSHASSAFVEAYDRFKKAEKRYADVMESYEIQLDRMTGLEAVTPNDISELERELRNAEETGDKNESERIKDELKWVKSIMQDAVDCVADYENKYIPQAKQELDEAKTAYNEQMPPRHLYTVEIPDDNGSNYLDWDKPLTEEQSDAIEKQMEKDGWTVDKNTKKNKNFTAFDKDGKMFILRRGSYSFRDVYRGLTKDLGSDKAASELLNEAGFTGIKYPADYRRGGRADGAKNYVIFNDKDLEITDHVRFFRGKGGEAYGFTVDGKIYIDPKHVNAETTIHEYAHLWATALQQKDAKAWGDVVMLMKDTGIWNDVREAYPELKTDDEIADEVLATYSGQRGAERLREEMRQVMQGEGRMVDKVDALSAMERVRNAIARFWRKVAEMLGIRYTKAEDVADHVLGDLLDRVNPNVGVRTDAKAREQFIGEQGAASIDHAEEVSTRMDNLAVARQMEADKKDAKAIKMATGWERGADGMWRYEIPDALVDAIAKIVDEKIDKQASEGKPLSGLRLTPIKLVDAIGEDHPLIKAYPKLAKSKIKFPKLSENLLAKYDGVDRSISFNSFYAKYPGGIRNFFETTLAHEVQHAIQDIEGFEIGDMPSNKNYNRLSGEVEARNVQKRMGMTPEERRQSLASETEDVAREDQIYLSSINHLKKSKRAGSTYGQSISHNVAEGVTEMQGRLSEMEDAKDVDAVKAAVRREGDAAWREANRKNVRIAEMLCDERKAELEGNGPAEKFSLRDGSFIRSGSYFSGGGLLEEGLKNYLDPRVAVEFNEKIAGVYADNFGRHIVTADVRNVDPRELTAHVDGSVEYFHASPVCKNFSRAKREAGEVELDKETAQSTADFIRANRPRVVTIENVKGYRGSDALKIITDALTEQGYDWDADVYNTGDFGGYTKRERLIVRAVRDGKLPEKPKPLPQSERKGGWMEAVTDLMDSLPEKRSGVPEWMDKRLKAMGIDWRHIDKPLYVLGQGDAADKVSHAFADELLPTLRTKGGDVIIMPDGRVLRATPRVLARVTGLADDYKMPVTDDMAHTIVGNGIPSQLSEHVVGPLLEHVFNGGEPITHDVKESRRVSGRLANTGYTSHVAQDIYEQAVRGRGFEWDEAWHDSLASVKALQDALAKERGADIRDLENVYLHMVHLSSVSAEEMTEYRNKQVENLLSAMDAIVRDRKLTITDENGKKHRITEHDVETYLNCKHGLERNEHIARKKAKAEADEKYADELKKLQEAYVKATDAYNKNPNQKTNDAKDVAEYEYKVKKDERDAYENDQYKDHRLNDDYSGLTGIFDDPKHPTMTNEKLEDKARDFVADMESEIGKDRVDDLWDAIHDATLFSLHKSYKSGLISNETYNEVKDMYEWYVPLRGFAEDTANDVYEYMEHAEPKTQQELKNAKGRKSRSDGILANIMNMGSSAILHGNQNLAKQKLLNLAINSKSNLLSLNTAYYKPSNKLDAKGKPYDELVQVPDYILNEEDADIRQQLMEQWAQQMESDPNVKTKFDKLNLDYKTLYGVQNEHAVSVFRGGKQYMVYVNGNPRAAQAINGTNIVRHDGALSKAMSKVTRWMSQMMTSYNASFVTSNAQRDFTSALLVSEAKYGAGYTARFANNVRTVFPILFAQTNLGIGKKSESIGGMYQLYFKYKHGTLDMSRPIEKYFSEFMANGGETGYTQSMSVDEYKDFIDKELKKRGRNKVVRFGKKPFGLFMNGVEWLNRGIENSCRFAAYMTSRETGRSVLQSVQDAKEVSTNFNLHGSGALGNAFFRDAYAFVNPAVQSLVQYAQLTKQHPWKMGIMAATTISLGALTTWLMSSMVGPMGGGDGDDDSDFWNINPYTRRNYLLIPFPGKGNWIKVAMAPEIRALYGLGVIAMEYRLGRTKANDAAVSILDQLNQLMPKQFVEPTETFKWDDNKDYTIAKQVFTNMMPTGAEPIWRAFIIDRDFMGRQITNQHDWNADDPEWNRASYNTSEWLVNTSKWLNNHTAKHGDYGEKGGLNFNPSRWGYLAYSYGAGLGQLYDQGRGLFKGTAGDDVDYNETLRYIPVFNRMFTTTNNDYNKYQQSNARFQYYEGVHDLNEHLFNNGRKMVQSGKKTNSEVVGDLWTDPDYNRTLFMDAGGWLKAIDRLKKLRKASNDEKEQREYTRQINEVRKNAVSAIMYIEENGGLDKLNSVSAGYRNVKNDDQLKALNDKRGAVMQQVLGEARKKYPMPFPFKDDGKDSEAQKDGDK